MPPKLDSDDQIDPNVLRKLIRHSIALVVVVVVVN